MLICKNRLKELRETIKTNDGMQSFATHMKSVNVLDGRTWVVMMLLSQLNLMVKAIRKKSINNKVESLDVGEKWMRLWVNLLQNVSKRRNAGEQIWKHVENFTYFSVILWNSIKGETKKKQNEFIMLYKSVIGSSENILLLCVTTVSMAFSMSTNDTSLGTSSHVVRYHLLSARWRV